ncbi:hypothetical protein QR97_31500 [Streptomyces sp. PBH53]|nr:hypothetical protein QR97_31500 [Streptomyces sp. PBH53]
MNVSQTHADAEEDVLPPAPPRPAAPLRPILQRALQDAAFAADVAVDGDRLVLTVVTWTVPWSPQLSAEAAREWMRESGIPGEARRAGPHVALHLPTSSSVHRLVAVLLEARSRLHATARGLTRELKDRGVDAKAAADPDVIALRLEGDHLASAVRFAELLGAPDIALDLKLVGPRGRYRLAERIEYLVTRITGSPVNAVTEAACAHADDSLSLYLSVDQADLLLQRLTHLTRDSPAPDGEDQAPPASGDES